MSINLKRAPRWRAFSYVGCVVSAAGGPAGRQCLLTAARRLRKPPAQMLTYADGAGGSGLAGGMVLARCLPPAGDLAAGGIFMSVGADCSRWSPLYTHIR